MKNDPQFQFSKEQTEEVRETLKTYFDSELEIELGNLQAVMFIDFLNQHIGKQYYNLGIADAMAAIKEKTDDLVLLIKE